MRAIRPFVLLAALPLLGAADAPGEAAEDARVLAAMRAELERTTRELRLPGSEPPYFVGYWVVDSTERSVEATLGAIVSDTTSRARVAKVDLRAGSRTLDNSTFSTGGGDDAALEAATSSPRLVPFDGDPAVVRRELWLETDSAYKSAVEALERKRAARRSEVAEDEPPSFSGDRSQSVVVPDGPASKEGDLSQLAARVSAVFREFPDVQRSDVHVLSVRTRRRFVASDGGRVVEPGSFLGIEVAAETQASDGAPLSRSAFVAATPGAELPEAQVAGEARRIARELGELRAAPVAEDYTGPVLFEGKAAAQIVYELLGESLSGTPPPNGNDDLESPFARRVGKRILPRGVMVVDDPSLDKFEGVPLLGHYVVDDEGILGKRVTLVEDGHLKDLLMSRSPREGMSSSNGHGRSGLVGWARGRPANLFWTAKGGLSKQALRAKLLSAVRDEGADYGLVVSELTPRTAASSGVAVPTPELVRRVGVDGKESLVRGLSLAQLPLRALRSILAMGREPTVYGFLAESDGGLDTGVSVVAPALLFEDVELRAPTVPNKKPPSVERPPLSTGG